MAETSLLLRHPCIPRCRSCKSLCSPADSVGAWGQTFDAVPVPGVPYRAVPEGVSQPSRRMQDLMRRKALRHDALLRQLRQELFRERTAAEQSVRHVSDSLRAELDKASLMVKLKAAELGELPAEVQVRAALLQSRICRGDTASSLTS